MSTEPQEISGTYDLPRPRTEASGLDISKLKTTSSLSTELRNELRNIVTRNGNTGRIPELLEDELDKLEALITKRETLARIDELTKMDGKLGVFYSQYEKFKNDSHDSKLLFKLRTNQLQQRLEKGLDTNHE